MFIIVYIIIIILLFDNINIIKSGYTSDILDYVYSLMLLQFGSLDNMSILEFGNQQYYSNYNEKHKINKYEYMKIFYENNNLIYNSIDIINNTNNIIIDVRKPIDNLLLLNNNINIKINKLDIITNIGFSEHIGENDIEDNLLINQYNIFKNLHDISNNINNNENNKVLYIHILPTNHQWLRHGVCYYNINFFTELIQLNNYKVFVAPIEYKLYNYKDLNMVFTMYNKVNNNEFISFEQFKNISGLYSIYSDYINYCDIYINYEHFITNNNNINLFHEKIINICQKHYIDEILQDCIKIVYQKCNESYTKSPNYHNIPV